MYKIELPKDMLKDLYLLREYAAQGSIIGQVRKSVAAYIREFSKKTGCSSPQELQEIVEKHERSKKEPVK